MFKHSKLICRSDITKLSSQSAIILSQPFACGSFAIGWNTTQPNWKEMKGDGHKNSRVRPRIFIKNS